jgi:hypothetical protein
LREKILSDSTPVMPAACQHHTSARILQLSRTESIDSAGKITILGLGKATTRAKRRITARVEGTGPSHRFPTRALRGNSAAPLKLAEA